MFLKLKQTINQLINSQHAFQRWNFEAIDMPLSSQRLEQYQRLIKQVTSNIQFAMTAPVIWAGIIPALFKHKTRLSNPHRHYKQFAEFGDEACFRHKKD